MSDRALGGCAWGRELLDEYGIPANLQEGLMRYLQQRIRPGGFLTAVLSNDLFQAVLRGTPASVAALPALVRFLSCECPAPAHGSPELVDRWTAGTPDDDA